MPVFRACAGHAGFRDVSLVALPGRGQRVWSPIAPGLFCRLHAVLCHLVAGGLPRQLSASRAADALRRVRPVDEHRDRASTPCPGNCSPRSARQIATSRHSKPGTVIAVAAASTTVTDVVGVGPIMAAYLIGYSGDIRRFPTAGHFARYNGTAPIEASSGTTRSRHRLNPRGNRQLNDALHIAAVTQIRNDTPGRAFYERKLGEGKTRKEALRALKRRISDAVYRQLVARPDPLNNGPGRATRETSLESRVAGTSPEHRHFGTATPGLNRPG